MCVLMKDKIYPCLLFMAKISFVIFPYRFSQFCCYLRNLLESLRFVVLTGCKGKAFIETPFSIKGHKYIKFKSFFSRPGLRIECWDNYLEHSFKPQIIIGEKVCFNFRCHIVAINEIIIGDNVLVGSNVLITDHAHGNTTIDDLLKEPQQRNLFSKGRVVIENDVWIGENVCILPNVVIGRGAVIAAGSVVTHSIPSYSVAAGIPARVIKM